MHRLQRVILAGLLACLVHTSSAQWCNRNFNNVLLNTFSLTQEKNYIAGGRDARAPSSVVAIQVYKHDEWEEDSKWTHVCGGVLLNEEWVLTAAHCIRDVEKYGGARVLFGSTHIDGGEKAYVMEYHAHPSFSGAQRKWYDIALLRLAQRISFTSTLGPACVNRQLSDTDSYQACIALGWGKSHDTSDFASKLQRVVLDRIPHTQCRNMYKNRSAIRLSEANQVCAGRLGQSGFGICPGDTGGPLFCRVKKSLNRQLSQADWELVGIAMTGTDCGSAQHPGIFIRVDKSLDWIRRTTGDMRILSHGDDGKKYSQNVTTTVSA